VSLLPESAEKKRFISHRVDALVRQSGQGTTTTLNINPVFRGMVRSGEFLTKGNMISIGVKELLDSGVHFGHQTKRWNPKMKPFIFDARNGIHIINLSKTVEQLEAACDFLGKTVRKGGKVIFVGTKKQAQLCVKETAKECGQFYVVERWLGGTLTNYATIKTSIKRLKEIEKMNADGSINDYVKQEQAVIRREEARRRYSRNGQASRRDVRCGREARAQRCG
jgi:ribosomal protein S2